jgi:hypothetical protein
MERTRIFRSNLFYHLDVVVTVLCCSFAYLRPVVRCCRKRRFALSRAARLGKERV